MATVEQATDNLEKWMERTVRGTLLGLSSRIIAATPVDTGRLRGNWQASIGTAKDGEISRTGTAGSINEARTESQKLEIGESFYLTNNLPYAGVVEFGSSSQAPQGMVRVQVSRLAEALNRAAK